MRGTILTFALALILIFATGANAANIFIDAEVTSQGADPNVVEMGDNFTLDIYMQNSSGTNCLGYSATWTIYSPTGNNVTYTNLGGATYGLPSMIMAYNGWLPTFTPGAFYWTTLNSYNMFNMDGALPDTFNHTTAGIPPTASWPASDDTRKLRFQLGMNSANAGTICIDSINYAPNDTYDWLWLTPSVPEWGGSPFCFNVIDPNAPQNHAPVLGAIGDKTVAEGSSLVIDLTATDEDAADTLGFSFSPSLANAALVNNTSGDKTATFTFNPDYTQAGTYPVTFTVTDGTDTDTETINIIVTPSNRPPVLDAIGDKSVDENSSLVINLSATDPDGNSMSFGVDPLITNATLVDHGNGTATYTFNPDFSQSGDYPVTFSVTDGTDTDEETITITVNNVNQTPILANIGDKVVAEGASLQIDLSATDGDNDALSFDVTPDIAHASLLDNGDGTATYTFDPDYTQAGDHVVEFSVTDGIDTDAETITITVTNTNRAPELAAIGNMTVPEGVTLQFDIFATDADGDPLTFSVDPAVPNAELMNNMDGTATYTFNPDYSQAGDIPVTFSVTDGTDSDNELITITVTDVNQPPVLSPIGPLGVEVGNTLSFVISAHDDDGTTPTLHADFLPANASLDDNLDGTAFFTFIPDASQVGEHEVLFYASDGVLADSEYVIINVTMGNVAPVLAPIGDQTIAEGENLTIELSASDGNGDDLTFSVDPVLLNSNLVDHGDGTATYTFDPNYSQSGVYPVKFTVSDGVLSDDETIDITVTDVNRAPVAVDPGAKSVDEGSSLNFTFEATDPDGDPLTLSVEGNPANSSFLDNGDGTGDFAFNPDFTQANVYMVGFIATDGSLADTVSVEITVNDVPQPPVLAAIGDKTVYEGETLTFIVSATDSDGDILSFSVDPELTNSTFTNNHDNTYTYIFSPDMDQQGDYDVTFTVSDGTFTDDETITISVIDVVPVTIVTDPTEFNVTLTEGQSANFDLDVAEGIDRNVDFTISDDASWLNIVPSAAEYYTTPMSFSLNINTTNVDPGDYTGHITISEYMIPGKQFSDVIVPVNLTVNALSTMPDSIWMSSVPGIPGNEAVVPVYFKTESMLSAINLPITWNSNNVVLDAVTFDGTVMNDYDTKSVTINNTTRRAMITIAPIFNGPIMPDRGMMAKLHFTVLETAIPGFVDIDSTTIVPGGGLAFVDEYYNMITPSFTMGTIIIGSGDAFVCGRVIDIYGHEIEGATVELWNSFPSGALISSHMTDVNGQFACESESIFPFDAYAYKEGYYPGTLEEIQVSDIGFDIVLTPVDMPVGSPYWVTFYCDNNTYYNVPLPVGSVVDAYDPQGVHCGSVFVTEPGKFTLAVFGDEINTIEDEGAEPGDEIDLFINGLPAKSMGDNVWTANGDRAEVCLDLQSTEDRSITLRSGWNLISWNVDTPIDDIDQVLAPIYDCIDVVLGFDQGGFTFDPALLDFSTLWDVDHMHGYWVRIKDDCGPTVDLPITGVPVSATTPIMLNKGWNLVSYLPQVEDTVTSALGSVNDNLILALGYDGVPLTYDPSLADYYWTLQHMGPGYGYWLKTMAADVLIYPGTGPTVFARQPYAVTKAATIDGMSTSRVWMNLYAHQLVLDNDIVVNGAEVLARTTDDRVVGRAMVHDNGKFGFMAVYGDDPYTSEKEGLAPGEKFYLVVDGVRASETFTWSEPGAKEEIQALSSANGEPVIPAAYSLSQNYPNPFNPSTQISFSVPAPTHVTVEVYNILGKKVATVFDDMAAAGENTVTWNGSDQNGNNVASGVYFYRMQADNFVESRKMVLMK